MNADLQELAQSIAARHATLVVQVGLVGDVTRKTIVELANQASDLQALYALLEGTLPPPQTPVFGCRVPLEELTDWTVQLVAGAGKPASIPAYGSGGIMERFRFHSLQQSFYVGPSGWGGDEPPAKPVHVRDVYVGPGFSKWGSNVNGVREELVEYLTVEGILPTYGGFEHGCYRKLQGGGDVSRPSITRRGCLYRNIAGAGVQIGHRDKWAHGGPFSGNPPMQECADLATCFHDTGPLVIERNRFERCSAAFDAASLSIHAPQKWDAGGRMPRACQDAIIQENEFDNASSVVASDLLYNTPLFIAGRKNVTITNNVIRRRSGIRTSSSILRPLMQLGDPFHPGTTWGTAFAPVVEIGGELFVSGNDLWSDEACSVHIHAEKGARVVWYGNAVLTGSAQVLLLLNGQGLGFADAKHSGTVALTPSGEWVLS